MRCIEIGITYDSTGYSFGINRNMRCIEIEKQTNDKKDCHDKP